jgi:quercetin dioxygenase-like cupin family protein
MSQPTLLPLDEPQSLLIAENTQFSNAAIVSRTVLQAPELRVVLFTFAEGQELTTHTNRRRALIQILDGTCEFFFAGKWQGLTAGALLHLPPEHPHAVRANSGSFSMLLTLGAEGAIPQENPSL